MCVCGPANKERERGEAQTAADTIRQTAQKRKQPVVRKAKMMERGEKHG